MGIPGLLAGCVTFGVLSVGYQVIATERDRRRFPPPGELVDIDGRRLHLWRAGRGAPAVVVVTALGAAALEWAGVQRELARDTTVCLYDRPGLGWSPARTRPETVAGMADDLDRLLIAGHVSPPYLLVGHSLGGMVARIYAANHPDRMLGLVLVDTPHDRQFERAGQFLDARVRARRLAARLFAGARQVAPRGLVRLGADIGIARKTRAEARQRFHGSPVELGLALQLRNRHRCSLLGEVHALLTAGPYLRNHAPTLGDLPLTVITRAASRPGPAGSGRTAAGTMAALTLWADLQSELAQLSTRGTLVVAEHAGHHIHREEPDVICRAVREIIADAQPCPLRRT
ncbi:alpha/beta fold hydrolase [Pseudarthrobacter sp. NPDC058196]|uniref:alpha/beta fold hydrolase n=1 Tax=Pseudarthrobacter sp. NPDC058196 TaxID=3346376 RepID=UPI0036DE5D39